MFGVSLPELIIVFVVALIVLGPEKLPEIARMFGKLTGEFRKHSNELRREFYNSVYTPSNELRNRINTEVQQLRSVPNIPAETAATKNPAESPTPAAAATESNPQLTEPGHVEEKKS
ncbi:MAG: twin-arginine translocase TatA/TatE family subunit [Deltaproteobacteria bacterium]|nr:twin-arginine translocase TatA/TatE family subunit [Deltaproteobacteria bacterium]